jgi:uncharacterized cupin superfamily protein
MRGMSTSNPSPSHATAGSATASTGASADTPGEIAPPSRPDARVAWMAAEAPLRLKPSNYPAPFAALMEGRSKRPLGELFGLSNFGVNLTTLRPGAVSALRHAHSRQDELVYVLQGHPVLRTDAGETPLAPGMCAGFRAGSGDAHQLFNPGPEEAVYLEIGDRSAGDVATYPDDDLQAVKVEGGWRFLHKDGTPY